jgi:hypothetical protein
MIGIWSASAQNFLLILGIATTIFFALPIFFTPMKWARLMLWRVPDDTDLAVYFGRCLGAFVIVIEFLIIRAGTNGTGIVVVFEAMMGVWLLMLVVHIWGWFKGIQPITETIEIAFWLLLVVLTLAFWPVGAASTH